MKNFYLILLDVIVLTVGGIFLFNKNTQAPGVNNETPPPSNEPPSTLPPAEKVVIYTDSGDPPVSLNINAGETVVFKNESSKEMWPASATHPTHTGYPGSDIEKCGTSEEPNIFDACRGIAPGGSWSFKFDIVGSWKYHDHLDVKKFGAIVVE